MNTYPNILVSIGNSDDKLGQAEWSKFIRSMRVLLTDQWSVDLHGEWFSAPDSRWQNANWCFQIDQTILGAEYNIHRLMLRNALRQLARQYNQTSIAWTEGPVEFLTSDGEEAY